MDTTSLVAIYQAPGSAYNIFDKVIVLYGGRQIYFGPIHDAKTCMYIRRRTLVLLWLKMLPRLCRDGLLLPGATINS